ncbi:PPE domain-containing protein [Actinosynnema sp. NPDC020468]|uniref:PPE domain-containing protein n=1 Tax=Actinosynnema sp. NPDC020468 TaxID=3154488 RepID=UPI003410E14B
MGGKGGGRQGGQGQSGGGQGQTGRYDDGQYHGGGGNDQPSHLGEKVDWLVYTHQALYDMVHTGVDLNSAQTAKSEWSSMGKSLGEVQQLLAKAITQSSQAWEGETADRARNALEQVEKWALNTSDHAENVATCIGEEIQHVQTARDMMPAPSPLPPVVTPVTGAPGAPVTAPGTPAPVATNPATRSGLVDPVTGATPTPTPQSPFTGVGNVAQPVVGAVTEADAQHRQAAEVMALFQQNSYEVGRTLPAFAPPTNPVAVTNPTPPTHGSGPGSGPGTGTPHSPDTHTSGTTDPASTTTPTPTGVPTTTTPQSGAAAASGGGGAFGGGGFGGYGAGRGSLPSPVTASGGGSGSGSAGVGSLSSPGVATGALANESRGGGSAPGGVTSQFQAPKNVTPQSGGMIGGPMAPPPMAPTGGGGEARDHTRRSILEEEDDVFGVDRAAPPVIGL